MSETSSGEEALSVKLAAQSSRRVIWVLVVTFTLLTWQALSFAISDAREEAEAEARTILSIMQLHRASGGADAGGMATWLKEASTLFHDVRGASLCDRSGCLVTFKAGATCDGSSDWQTLCVTVESQQADGTRLSIRHSLMPAYEETGRDLLIFALVALGGWLTWRSTSKALKHQIQQGEINLRQAAERDVLTGLLNRAGFEHALNKLLQQTRHRTTRVAVFINIDRFKDLNDTLGHEVGDTVLKAWALRLEQAVKQDTSALARVSGDEFAVMLPAHSDGRPDASLWQAIHHALLSAVEMADRSVQVAASMAIVPLTPEVQTTADVFQRADVAMGEAKRRGRARSVLYDDALGSQAKRRLLIQTDLKAAIASKQVFLVYQPQVDMHGHLRGVEALLRWQHPREGAIRPDEFIPVAEETGLILPLGMAVVELACQDLVSLRRDGLMLPYISINVSPKQLADPNWPGFLINTVKHHGLAQTDLELEVTEGCVMEDGGAETSALDQLASMGFRLAIDDFGTGYSSLSRLQRMKVDKLKIDRSFITALGEPGNDPVLIEMMLGLARRLGIKSVAEGVELPRQLQWLEHAGCLMVQGYYFAKPMPLEQLKLWVLSNQADQAHAANAGTWEPTLPGVL